MIKYLFLDKIRDDIRQKKDSIASLRDRRINRNPYYYGRLLNSLRHIIPEGAKVLNIGCGTGYLLNRLKPAYGVGIEASIQQVRIAKAKYPELEFYDQEPDNVNINGIFDYILVCSVEDTVDLKGLFDCIRPNCGRHTRIVVYYYNYLWQPLVSLAEKCRMRIPQHVHNWFSDADIDNILRLSNFEPVNNTKIILFPFYIPLLSTLIDRFLARLPGLRKLTMTRLTVARLHNTPSKNDYSVSIVIPCRNEAGNIEDAVKRIPMLGKHTEIIFCDDKSTDGTPDVVRDMQKKFPDKDIKLVDGPGICKADNVWTGFDAATSDILLILDADLTVIPEELPYFYEAIATGQGEFINGSRLVYPMHDAAMRFFNIIGNKFFSIFFSYILDTQIKDTLCGTKVFWREDYAKIKKLRGYWGIKDRWGDYELIFGAAKNHLKIIDMPVHYMERTYGETKMTNRFKNGWIMLRMCMVSLFKIKFH
ncbi:MAG: glycosyltransferase [Lentisphaerae bacterium]|nr:glycosyltransferase [Victivallaceae bacterium]MDD5663892.1 glycosyltransferase [Victivallaceae bacterium]NLK82676.1 glycosyltransferase [Lentisphaerota bacterium]